MAERKIRWGVISTANIGRAAVIPAIQASRPRAEAFAAKLGIPKAYGSYEALLEAEDIDAVYIPLPNSLHREWTLRAAEMGKHILCEKPLGLTAQECLEMEAAADRNKGEVDGSVHVPLPSPHGESPGHGPRGPAGGVALDPQRVHVSVDTPG